MSGLQCLTSENIWFDKHRYDEAEKRFYEGVNGPSTPQQQVEQAHNYNPKNSTFLEVYPAKEQSLGLMCILNILRNKDMDLANLYFQSPSCLLLASFEVPFVSCLTLP